MYNTTHSCVWRDSCSMWSAKDHRQRRCIYRQIFRLWHGCVWGCQGLWHDSFKCVTWLIRTCDMTHSYVWHDSFGQNLWLSGGGCEAVKVRGIACLYVWGDLLICVTRFFHKRDVLHLYVWRDPFVHVTWLMRKNPSVLTRLRPRLCKSVGDVTLSHARHDWFICVTWLIQTKTLAV